MYKIFLFLIFFCLVYIENVKAQQVRGIIKDYKTGETISNVIISNGNKVVAQSNSYGFYSLKLNNSNNELIFNTLGYNTIKIKLPKKDTILNILLESITTTLKEIELNTKKNNITNLQTGTITISQEKIKAVPSITGSPDILKVFQLLPGVQTANEGTTNLNIRGGSYDQNLILLDEAPIYNPAHALGFFSTFNSDAIKNATIYKGNFPAQFGGRLSSVIDIIMKEGNNKAYNNDVTIGLTANQITLQGPFKKNKSSYLVGFRNSNVSNLFKAVNLFYPVVEFTNDQYIRFWDMNIKTNFILNENNKIYFSFYTSRDNYNYKIFSLINNLEWSNISGTIRWNHIYNKKLFSNLSIYGTQYESINKNFIKSKNFTWLSGVKEFGLKKDFTNYLNNNNTLKFGVSFIVRKFNPGIIDRNDSINTKKQISNNINTNYELSGYISNEQVFNDKLSLLYGLRTSLFADIGPHTQYKIETSNGFIDTNIYTPFGKIRNQFLNFEPRITLRYLINKNSSIKLNYTYSQQNIHLISNSTAGLPYDYWVSASKEILPQTSYQFLLGYYTELFNKKINFSFETYYKILQNILDFKDNSNLLVEPNIEFITVQGKGQSYGVELYIEKLIGKFTGWLSYTLAKTQYKLPNVNNNEWYSPRYDIRHNVSIVTFYKLNNQYSISSTFKLTSGGFISFPTRSFLFDGAYFSLYEKKNNFELPTYHRLDLSVNYNSKKNQKRKIKKEWIFTIYNVYGNENIFSLVTRQDPGFIKSGDETVNTHIILNGTKVYKFFLFSVIPTISLNLKF